jgi:hypothetical protein
MDRIGVQHLRHGQPVLVELRRQFDEIARHAGAGNGRIGHVREHAVQRVAEFVEQRARVVEGQEGRLALRRLGEIHRVEDDRRLAESFDCDCSPLIQAPERFDGRAK